ncbi:SusC/RagA family TonB-linked outer membrane protein [Sphingobacterium faecale]|uniref:TonB-dependent receptor n=1 Tax=Sphingobacterium faecale TaxID=2803775 RepID=A0ABS1R5X6_9SPHI|nr:TonB-dependent receptor [Sphingobacterium faecale]MBL1409271.1 TonB-dependent receptor [Sphingobacterium faecale]
MVKKVELLCREKRGKSFQRSCVRLGVILSLASVTLPVMANEFGSFGNKPHRSISQLQKSIKGSVTNEQGEALPGVTVLDLSTGRQTTTDEKGRFVLNGVQSGAKIRISSVGYLNSTITVLDQIQSYDVTLKSGDTDLETVVVVGYGKQKKINLTGAVDIIKGDDLVKQPVGQTSSALQGAAPGLTVKQASGQPGRDEGNLRIRGIGTLGDSNPLVIIDGVEGNINNVNANDIASISVLKDASSASIYGSRAANGVILITTKRAEEGKVQVDYNNYIGTQTPTKSPKMVNGLDHMLLLNEAYVNAGMSPLYTQKTIDEYTAGRSVDSDKFPDTDWQKLTMKENAFMQNHYLSVNAGNENARVLGSFGYLNQDGIIPNTNFRKYNFRVNSDVRISEKLSTAMDLAFVKSAITEPADGTGNIFHWMRRIPANQAGLFSNGQYGEGWNGDNPIAKAKDGGLKLIDPLNMAFNVDLKYQPFEGFTALLAYSPKYEIKHEKTFKNTIQTYYADGSKAYMVPQKNSLTERYGQYWYNNFRAVLNYEKEIGNGHNIAAMGGYQQEDQDDNWLLGYRENFQFPEFQEINSGGTENQSTEGNASQWSLRSFFGRLNYSFKGKYLFEVNGRYDGSSRFATGKKYSFFPSFSAGWRMSEEEFMQPLKPIISDAKLRASWGQLGNQEIGLYPFSAFMTIGANNYTYGSAIATGAALNNMANSEIKWETTEMTNLGLDIVLWKNLSITADYYYRKTHDILLQLDIPKVLGLKSPFQNAGVVENKGWDLTVAYKNSIGNFEYNVAVNLSDVKNKILDMKGISKTALTSNLEGHPIGAIWGLNAIGYYKDNDDVTAHATQFGTVAPGDIKYEDVNGDGKINEEDKMIIGSPIPRYTYSANLGGAYKGFDFSLFFQGVGKADGYLYGQGIMPFYQGGTVQEQHKDRWTPDNTNAAFPRYAFNQTNNIQNSTFWLKSASYLRLKNVSIGYSFKLDQVKYRVSSVRVFASGQNLFTQTNFWKGYDPEGPVSTGGWYPQMRVYSFGLGVRF